MRTLAGLFATLLLVGAIQGGSALAQDDDRWPTTKEVARCRYIADQPMCLLSIFAWQSRPSIETRVALWRKPEFLAELEAIPRPPIPNEQFASDGYLLPVYDRASDDYVAAYQAIYQAVFAAVALNQNGTPPQEALEPIRSLSADRQRLPYDGIHLVAPEGAGELRMLAYWAIWIAYADERGEWPVDRPLPGLDRPSESLARGALSAWEAEWESGIPAEFYGGGGLILDLADVDVQAERLAHAYEQAGDAEGAARARSLMFEDYLSEADHAMREGRLDDALAMLGGAENACAAPLDDMYGLSRLINIAVRSDRPDLAVSISRGLFDCESIGAPKMQAIETVARYGDPAEVLAMSEQLDSVARTASVDMDLIASDRVSTAAVGAVIAWRELDRLDRAQALLDIWRPLAEARQLETDCGIQVWYQCLQNTVIEMYWTLDRLPEALDGLGLSVDEAMGRYDTRDRLGASRVEYWLDFARTPQERDALLQECVLISQDDTERSIGCARRLLAEAGARALTDEQRTRISDRGYYFWSSERLGGPYVAAETALTAAAHAARFGETGTAEDMQELLEAALDIWISQPEAQLGPSFDDLLEAVALAQLRNAGRL